MPDWVVGADIGGTSTRIAVATIDGDVLAVSVGGPGNPNTVGLDGSATEIRRVMERALSAATTERPAEPPGEVVSVVIGLAGGSRAAEPASFLRAATAPRVEVEASLVSDLTVAFCSATPALEGYVLLAGTGAVAGQVSGTDLVQQRDGWGWLLGDEGSGFWLGRAAARHTLEGLQRRTVLGPLQRAVLAATGTTSYLELLQASYAASPTWLAQFSRLVSEHAAGDPAAAAIADEAVVLLERLLVSLDPAPDTPVVLAGSVLITEGPVSAGLRERLSSRVANPILSATSGVVGALWIGLRDRVGDAADVHDRLVATAGHGR